MTTNYLLTCIVILASTASCRGTAPAASAVASAAQPVARTVDLQSQADRGAQTHIGIKYQLADEVGGSEEDWVAKNIVIRVDNPQYGTGSRITAVFISNCDLQALNTNQQINVPYTQLVDGSGFGYQATVHGDYIVHQNFEGQVYSCTQQIAVAVDDNWLTDPVSGQHNFNFSMY